MNCKSMSLSSPVTESWDRHQHGTKDEYATHKTNNNKGGYDGKITVSCCFNHHIDATHNDSVEEATILQPTTRGEAVLVTLQRSSSTDVGRISITWYHVNNVCRYYSFIHIVLQISMFFNKKLVGDICHQSDDRYTL